MEVLQIAITRQTQFHGLQNTVVIETSIKARTSLMGDHSLVNGEVFFFLIKSLFALLLPSPYITLKEVFQ